MDMPDMPSEGIWRWERREYPQKISRELPEYIRFYDFKAGISIGQAQARIKDAPWPVVAFHRGFLTFACLDELAEHFGPYLPFSLEGELPLDDFLQYGWSTLGLKRWDARNRFSDLARQAIEASLRARGLEGYQLRPLREEAVCAGGGRRGPFLSGRVTLARGTAG